MEVTVKKISTRPGGVISIPGSKSVTNRSIILATLASGVSTLTGCSLGDDSQTLIDALKKVGVQIKQMDSAVIINGTAGQLPAWQGEINIGAAGTTMRFLAALFAASEKVEVTLSGSSRMHERPIGELVSSLRELGADIQYLGKEGYPPLRINGRKLLSKPLLLEGSTSSQFTTALLLISPLLNSIDINFKSTPTSSSYLELTLESLEKFEINGSFSDKQIKVRSPKKILAKDLKIEGDLSGASYLWAIAAIGGGEVTVANINTSSKQGDLLFPEILKKMGCTVLINSESITVSGKAVKSLSSDLTLLPDTAQTLAVIASTVKGESKITGLHTLRIKETDRIEALAHELSKVGITSTIGLDYIVINGAVPSTGSIKTYEDHRMAMSFAPLAAITNEITIQDSEVVSKSYPNFWDDMKKLGFEVIYSKPKK